MDINRPNRPTTRMFYVFMSICILVLNLGSIQNQSGCSEIYNGANGWIIDMCATDPAVTTPMQILVDGISKGDAAVVRIYHRSQSGAGTPQVAVIYASGYVRLKQNADPAPSVPFGTSFVLGPAYWTGLSTYYHNPQLNQLEVDTTWLPDAPLRMRAQGTNHDFDVNYAMVLPSPRDRQTRLHVDQTYTATADINIDPTRRAEHQGFKLIQASSMFINEGGVCDGGYTDCHDSNSARFIGEDLVRHQTAFTDLTLPAFVFTSPVPLGSTWLDVLHTDDQGWQSQTGVNSSGNTPNVRIALDDLPATDTITPQGWIGPTTNPNDDNAGLWLHDDGPASASWQAGQSNQISYWLLVQDNPPEPWSDLELRSGLTFLDFEESYNCSLVKDATQPTTGAVTAINGYSDTALQLDYDLGSENGNWAQIRCNFDPPLDLSAYDHLRFDWRGDPAAANSLQVGLINPTVGGEHIFARGYHHATQHAWWGQMIVPFTLLESWTSGAQFDPSQVSALFISVVKDPVADVGGAGRFAVDNLNAYNVGSRAVPVAFETVDPNQTAARAAADWLASQQTSTGLLKSWEEESSCLSHTYDQALALMVLSDQGMWTEANALVDGMANLQNDDGSWFKSRNCTTLDVVGSDKWEGDIAWMIYALDRYLKLGGTHLQAATALQKGADWLTTRVNPADGCLVIDHTEGTIDAWWAFRAAGESHIDEAEQIKSCLLTYYWDDSMGRFKGGRNWWQPYLDNQTWGSAFLKAIGETEKAHRALGYARDVLRLPAQGGQLFGLDGQAGPWSVWNEGTAQYIAVGGEGANDLLSEVLAQQRNDGALVGSPDEFSGGGVWTTRWHGVAPTAWLYNALCGEPFHPGGQSLCTIENAPPGSATLISPTGSITATTPSYTWEEVSTASWYYLWVNGPSGNLLKRWYEAAAICSGDICSVTPTTALSPGVHRWWVQTWNNEGYGPWSAEMTFTLPAPILPGKAILTKPIGNTFTTTPTYTWTAASDTTWYYLYVNGPSGNVIKQWYDAAAICSEGTCSVTPTTTLSAGAHKWWIQTWGPTGYGPWSDTMNFIVAVPGKASLTAPAGSISDPTPDYTWSAVEGATWYYLYVNGPSGAVIKQWFDASLICSDDTCTITPSTALSAGAHKWWIQTWGPTGYGSWSDTMNFTVAVPGKAILSDPTGSITYTWGAVEGATWYYLWVNGPSGNVIKQWYEAAAVCSGATCSVTPTTTLGSGAHKWWGQS